MAWLDWLWYGVLSALMVGNGLLLGANVRLRQRWVAMTAEREERVGLSWRYAFLLAVVLDAPEGAVPDWLRNATRDVLDPGDAAEAREKVDELWRENRPPGPGEAVRLSRRVH